MLPERLHDPKAPAHPLLDKLPHVLRRLRHCHGIVLVLNDIACLVDTHRQVTVLSQCVGGQAASPLDGFLPESTNGTGHHRDGIDIRVSHPVKVLTRGVFDRLPAREHVTLVADLDISCHSPDAVVLVGQEVLHELTHRVGTQLGICVDAHHIFRVGMGDTIVQCRSLAAIGLAEDEHLVIAIEGVVDALQGVVLTAVVDKDDVERRIILPQQRLHGTHTVDLLVISRDDDRHVRRVVLGQRGIVAVALHTLLPNHEIVHEAQAQEAEDEEYHEEGGEEVTGMIDHLRQCQVGLHGIIRLSLRDLRHELGARHTEILFQGDEVIPLFLQRLNDTWQSGNCWLTGESTGIVHQDDMSIAPVHAVDDTPVDLVGGDARLPVVGVYLLPHEEIVAAAGEDHRLDLLVLRGIGIGIVRRTEEDGALSGDTLEEHTGELELGIGAVVGVLDHIVVGEGVVADGEAVLIDFLHQRQVLFHLQADHEESSGRMITLEGAQDRGRPAGIRAVIKGQQQIFGTAMAEFRDRVGGGQALVALLRDDLIVGVYLYGDLSGLRLRLHVEDLARTDEVDIVVTGQPQHPVHVPALHLLPCQVFAIEVPQAVVFGAETPKAKACQMIGDAEAHDII